MAISQTALESSQVKIVEPQTILERVNNLSEQIARRAYEIFEGKGRVFGQDLDDWFQAESEISQPLDLRIKEKDDSLTVDADVQGFGAKDLEVSLDPWRLTISGKLETTEERKKDKATYQEQSLEQFLRVIHLPAQVDRAKATATLKNGRLEINIPKASTAIAKRVDVNAP